MKINAENEQFNFRFPLFFSIKPNRTIGLFCCNLLKIKSDFFGRSPPDFLFFPKTIQKSIQRCSLSGEISGSPSLFFCPSYCFFLYEIGEIHSTLYKKY